MLFDSRFASLMKRGRSKEWSRLESANVDNDLLWNPATQFKYISALFVYLFETRMALSMQLSLLNIFFGIKKPKTNNECYF